MKSIALASALPLAILAGCAEPTRPLARAELPSSTAPAPKAESPVALVLADAAARVVPALGDTIAQRQLARALLDLGSLLTEGDSVRAQRSLSAAQDLLDRYAARAPEPEAADLGAIRLALDHARSVISR